MTAAAKAMHVTQSAVTKAGADVEDDLGFTLFDRRARGVVVTAAGRDFIDRAARIVSEERPEPRGRRNPIRQRPSKVSLHPRHT